MSHQTARITNVERTTMPVFQGSIDLTIIEHSPGEGDDTFPTVYVDHSREWIEVADYRFTGPRAEVVAWLRAVADALATVPAEAGVR